MIAVFDSEVMMRPANDLARMAQVLRAYCAQGLDLAAACAAAFEVDRKGIIIAKTLRGYLHQGAGFHLYFSDALTGTAAFIADAKLFRSIFNDIAGTICAAMLDLQQQFRISQAYFLARSASTPLFQRPLAMRQPVEQGHAGCLCGRCDRKSRQDGGCCADAFDQF